MALKRMIDTNIRQAIQFKPYKIPPGMELLVDTREQKPLFTTPIPGLIITRATVHDGDYTIRGYENLFCVERKFIGDFMSYIGSERQHKTIGKMERFRAMIENGGWVGLAIEESEDDLYAGLSYSRMTAEHVRGALKSFRVRYGVHCYFHRDRGHIERWILDSALEFDKVHKERLKENCNGE